MIKEGSQDSANTIAQLRKEIAKSQTNKKSQKKSQMVQETSEDIANDQNSEEAEEMQVVDLSIQSQKAKQAQQQSETKKIQDCQKPQPENVVQKKSNDSVKVAFEGFDNQEKVRLSNLLKQTFDMETINMPSKINQSRYQLVIVSKNGQSKDVKSDQVKGVVNAQWVEDSVSKKQQLQDYDSYGFTLSEMVFFIFDALDADSHPQQHSMNLRNILLKQNAKVLSKYCDLYDKSGKYAPVDIVDDSSNLIILIKQQRRDFKDAVQDIELMIKHFKITFKQFEQMQIISDQWAIKSIMKDEKIPTIDYNLGMLFKIMISGDRSVFYVPPMTKQDQNKARKKSLQQNVYSVMEQWTKYSANELNILEDCVITFYGNEDQHGNKLANLLGANITDSIIPTYTTHIVTENLTPQLKQSLTLLQNKSSDLALRTSRAFGLSDNMNQQQVKVIGQSHTFKLVTVQWLEECLLQEKWVAEDKFTPEYVKDNKTVSEEEMLRFRKQQYKAKSKLFNNITFSIQEDSFDALGDQKDIVIENMIRTIMEQGGKIIPQSKSVRSHYLICEDGSVKDIWNNIQSSVLDKLDRKIIHFRWVKHCIKANIIEDDCEFLYLYPLPKRVPIVDFNQAILLFTRCQGRQKEEQIFRKVCKLYGFNYYSQHFKSQQLYSKEQKQVQGESYRPTHIVVFGDEELKQSTTISYYYKIDKNNLPLIVNTNWLIDCMFNGQFIDVTKDQSVKEKYIIDLAHFKPSY
ncbi:UNKNOWN [Stylonychia lemnae]|uniref:BRCT domain-containing protein n=1 Tax=Stylonychia lemnae TaxID=5949 RepID=A0A077ZWY6_STYLE|nr:UNKNOWN [Stylonychia lemnae]|eukprot:CDW73016.1 UNKNOWN [Stylonychia lemnae]